MKNTLGLLVILLSTACGGGAPEKGRCENDLIKGTWNGIAGWDDVMTVDATCRGTTTHCGYDFVIDAFYIDTGVITITAFNGAPGCHAPGQYTITYIFHTDDHFAYAFDVGGGVMQFERVL